MTKREIAERYQQRAAQLLAQAEAEETALATALTESEKYKQAYQTAYAAFFDGVKYVHSPDKAFPIELPMNVMANMYYKDTAGTIYVAVQTGEATEETFTDYFEPLELSAAAAAEEEE